MFAQSDTDARLAIRPGDSITINGDTVTVRAIGRVFRFTVRDRTVNYYRQDLWILDSLDVQGMEARLTFGRDYLALDDETSSGRRITKVAR